MKNNDNKFIPLELETRSAIPTDAAAFHLCKRPQTLRAWACLKCGPIIPLRVNGRLLWSVSEIKNFLKV